MMGPLQQVAPVLLLATFLAGNAPLTEATTVTNFRGQEEQAKAKESAADRDDDDERRRSSSSHHRFLKGKPAPTSPPPPPPPTGLCPDGATVCATDADCASVCSCSKSGIGPCISDDDCSPVSGVNGDKCNQCERETCAAAATAAPPTPAPATPAPVDPPTPAPDPCSALFAARTALPSSPSDGPVRIEAEDYCNMFGIQTESTSDAEGGGDNVGYIDAGDWLAYPVTVPTNDVSGSSSVTTTTYEASFRIASLTGDGSFHLEYYGGGGGALPGTVVAEGSIPSTGSWQGWTTLSGLVRLDLPEGDHVLAIKANGAGWNLNWLDFTAVVQQAGPPSPLPTPSPSDRPSASPAPSVPLAHGFLQTRGTDIVVSAEDPAEEHSVILRGMGFGGWMVQEPYMMLVSSSAAEGQHSIFADVEELVGATGLEAYQTAWLDNYCTEADVRELKRSGFNSLRVALHYNLFTLPIEREPTVGEDTWLADGFDRLDALLGWCQNHGIYLILDLHAAPGGQGRDSNINDYDPSLPSLWESAENVRKTVALWERLALRYRDETWVGGYDLLNEPNWGFDGDNDKGCSDTYNQPLKDFYDVAIPAIRAIDQNHIIYVEGNCWGNNHNNLWPIDDDNIVLSFHRYWIDNTLGSIQAFLDLRDALNVPLWVGETGENTDQWYADAVALLEGEGIGWAWWTWKKMSSDSGSFSITPPSGYDDLRAYWESGGTPPNATFALDVMLLVAEAARLDSATRNYGAIDALTSHVRCDAGVRVSTPIPQDGTAVRIEAEDYCQKFGVVVEECNDVGGGDNMGWIDSEDWMAYPISVPADGTYTVTYRVASFSGDGSFNLEIYGGANTLGTVTNLPSTGSWQNWDEVSHSVVLSSGDGVVAVKATVAGWNLNWLEISGPPV